MKKIAIGFAILGTAICAFVAWRELASPTPRYVELGNILVLTLTLIVLVWYAYDTNAIARITRERWEREGVLATTYSIAMPGTSVGDNGHTVFQLKNGSPLVVRALVNFNFKVYGHPVAAGPLYDGKKKWLLYPHQMSQGWFEVETLLQQQGKNTSAVRVEATDANSKTQLSVVLEMTFWDEFGVSRILPPRPHYFDFRRWAWIPSLGEEGE